MRAAYAALVFGVAAGLILTTGVLSGGRAPRPTTVAAVLAVDVPGIDIDRRRSEAVAVLVSTCMTRHGIALTPWVERPPSLPDPDLGPVEWARRWGFGISTTVGHGSRVVPADPNLGLFGTAPPDERDARRRALYGFGGHPGCQATATDEVYGLRARLMTPLRAALDGLEAEIAADPAAERALAMWRDCVAPVAEGLTLERQRLPAALMERVSDRLGDLGTTPATIAGLAGIQAAERRTATLLADCEAAFAADRAEVAAPYEAAFVDEHRAALERAGAAIREAEATLPALPP